jgi:hypothetical protein
MDRKESCQFENLTQYYFYFLFLSNVTDFIEVSGKLPPILHLREIK